MRSLKLVDYVYITLSCLSGLWQGWCLGYRRSPLLVIPMGIPFALASGIYAWLSSRDSEAFEQPDWKHVLILWAGIPVSLALSALTMLAETGIMSVAGFGVVDLPFGNLRHLIGESVACLAWATCLLLWSQKHNPRLPRRRFLAIFAALFICVLLASGLSKLILGIFHKDIYFVLTSVAVTTLSALILILLKSEGMKVGGNSNTATGT